MKRNRSSRKWTWTVHPSQRNQNGWKTRNGELVHFGQWPIVRTIQFQDTPEAAKRPTTARTVLAAQVLNGNPLAFLEKLNQEYHYEYILKGHRLVHNNIIMTVFQIFKVELWATQVWQPSPIPYMRLKMGLARLILQEHGYYKLLLMSRARLNNNSYHREWKNWRH
jgi:Med18 protein